RNVLGDLENELPHWEAVVDGNPDWDAVFRDAQSTCDWPSARWYADLIDYYPDAKVILTVRSAEGWVKSMRETVWGIFYGDSPLHYLSAARTTIDPLWRRYIDLMTRINWDEQSGAMAGDTFSDEGLAAIMNRWNDEVKS